MAKRRLKKPDYNECDLIDNYGQENASRYLKKIWVWSDANNVDVENPFSMARKWLERDGFKSRGREDDKKDRLNDPWLEWAWEKTGFYDMFPEFRTSRDLPGYYYQVIVEESKRDLTFIVNVTEVECIQTLSKALNKCIVVKHWQGLPVKILS